MIGPSITGEALCARRWSFGEPKRRPFAPQMILFPDGRIGGMDRDEQRQWRLVEGDLVLFDIGGMPSVRFGSVIDQNQVLRFEGSAVADGSALVLKEVTPAQLPADRAAAADPGWTRDCPEREFLVIVRAGPNSRHHEWKRDIPDLDRTWQLCLSYYGSDPGWVRTTCDLLCHQLAAGVLMSLNHLLHDGSALWKARYIMVCDEHVSLKWSDINRLFARMVEHNLLIAQPAMSLESRAEHEITRVQEGNRLRFTGYVGKTAPVFESSMLRLAAPTFGDVLLGQGLDHLWCFLAGRPKGRIAVIDDVVVDYVVPVPEGFDAEVADAEERVMQQLYGFERCYEQYGTLSA